MPRRGPGVMHASFFPPPGSEPDPPEHPPAPPWLHAPQDELPERVLVREFLAQTPGTVLVVSHVDVYSVGIRIKVDWELRRVAGDTADLQAVAFPGFRRGGGETGSVLRYGVALSNGRVVTTVDRDIHRSFTEEPDGWSLMDQMGGGGGDDSRYSGTSGLWLWPLPPAGPIELVGEWGARGIGESRLILDGAELLSHVGDVRALWP